MFRDLILAYHKDMYDKNEIRVEQQKKQYSYYTGNSHEIKEYLVKALEITYDSDDVQEMQLQWVNLTKKIINQMAVVYRDPASRYILFNEQKRVESKDEQGNTVVTNPNEQKEKELTDYYNSILPEDINSQDKKAHRLASLHNSILTQIMLDEKTGKIKYKTKSSWLFDVKTDDDGNITEVSYPKYFKNDKGEDEEFTVVWTDKELYRLDKNSNRLSLPNKSNQSNPFKKIPFALLQMEECDDIWGDGKSDVVNVNEQVNLLLTKLVNSDIIMGTEGTTLAINLDLRNKGKVDDQNKEGLKKIRTGRKHPIVVENVRSDMAQPSLQHVTTDPHIEDIKGFIDWYIMYIAGLHGLRGTDIISEIKDTSDYQKIMDSIDQMELRRDDIEPLRIYEKQRFNLTRIVNNAYVGATIGNQFKLKMIPDDVDLKVDFAEIEVHLTIDDKQKDYDWKLSKNLISIVDIAMEENPDLTRDEAMTLITKNKTDNSVVNRNSVLDNFIARRGGNLQTQTGQTG